MEDINNSSDEFKTFLKEIYNQIKEEHKKDKYCDEIPKDLPIDPLLNVELRPYQYKSLRWLLNREFNPGLLDSSTGGILADEMGLGKTIEILSLILLNERKNLQILETEKNMKDEYSSSDDEPLIKIQKSNGKKTKRLYCVCRKTNKTNLIECTKCHTMQHKNCVAKYDDKINNKKYEKLYICPECWTNNHTNIDTQQLELIKSKTTIIISPQIIANQWHDEIKKCSKNSLEIFIYDGIVKSGWINPELLSKYDIIITNYTVLQKEIHYHMQRSHNLRTQKTYIRVDSPLLFIEWWRVCLDEAQMVENVTNNAAKMVKQLPAIHRWAVTGTPIHKCIDDLRGLLEFLEIKPYYEQQEWKKLTNSYINNEQPKLLIELLAKFMWRTCKNDVANELNIPEQTYDEHFVKISDVEKLFYNDELQSLLNSFEEKVRKYVRIHTMANLDKKTIRLLLEPLRKLRQNCSTPVLHQRTQQNMIKKRLLSPQELSEHLIDKNQILCKTSLRTIVSCYNGMAAVHMLVGEYKEAINCYEAVLEIAKDYNGPICVDSLLQIHALHNLMLAKTELNLQIDLNEYNNQCKNLEWKYLEAYYNDLMKALTNVNTSNNEVNECIKKFKNNNISNWWHNILAQTLKTNTSQQLINKINDERRLLTFESPTILLADFPTIHGVDYALGDWTNKIIKQRENIFKMFQLFDHFINNIKPLNQLPVQIQNEMKKTIRSVIDCHLITAKKFERDEESSLKEDDKVDDEVDNEVDDEEEDKGDDNILKEKCDLCKIKEHILEYECTIYRKTMKKQKKTAEGDSNPSFHETILRIVLNFARIKFIGNDLEAVQSEIDIGDLHLKYLDALKKEQKVYTKLWIEIEYVIKAYDELDMCKMRLQYENNVKNNEIYGINPEKLQETYLQNKLQLISANAEFKQQQGRLNYINHLTSGSDMGSCPICKLDSYQEYSVMECGHFLCLQCLKEMAEVRRPRGIICAICRQPHNFKDLFLVTKRYQTSEEKRIVSGGQYSSKIEEILFTVTKLRREDRNVKIIIFSHWSIILGILGNALSSNDINYRISATPKNIREFKDPGKGVTCFLLQLKQGSKGLNLIEATHVFLIEPILDPGEEAQAIGRIHRIGQTRPTVVHRFIVKGTIEEAIHNATSADIKKIWCKDHLDIDYIRKLFLYSLNQ